jgi:hypothetical protein
LSLCRVRRSCRRVAVGGVALADTGDSGSAAAGAGYFGTVGRQIGFILGNLGL